jgi:glycosyltransferase involved in cell wall biosynthesis
MNNDEFSDGSFKFLRSRIVFILLSPLPSPSAAWTRIGFFATYLKEHGIDVTVAGAFSARSLEKAGIIEWEGVKIYNMVPVIILNNHVVQILNFVVALFASIYLFVVLRPRVVIISVPSSGNPLACYITARMFRCDIITDYRDEWEDYIYSLSRSRISRIYNNMNRNMMSRCYRNSRIVVTVTEPLAKSLNRRGVKNENLRIIQNGADTRTFRPKDKQRCREKFGIPKDDFVLIYSGHIGGYYRVDLLVRALKQAEKSDANIRLIIAGHGSSLQVILRLAKDIGLQDKVVYIGKIMNKEDLADALSASDIGIVPFDSNQLWKNALPAKFLEYLSCGLPVVATVYPDSLLGKMIAEYELGLVAQPEDVDSLSNAISRLKVDRKVRSIASTRAISVIHQNYDRHKLASRFLSDVLT